MRSRFETKDYILDFEKGTCIVKENGMETQASGEVMLEIARSTWREEKQNAAYNDRTLSYNKPATDDCEFIEFFEGSTTLETEIMFSQKELCVSVKELMNLLPEKLRIVAEMYYFKGMTERAIGKELGVSEQLVHYRKGSFLKKARKMVEGNEEKFSGLRAIF